MRLAVGGGREEQVLFCWDSVMHDNENSVEEDTVLKISEVNEMIGQLGFGIRRLSLIDACSTRIHKGPLLQASILPQDIRFGLSECTFSATTRMLNLW